MTASSPCFDFAQYISLPRLGEAWISRSPEPLGANVPLISFEIRRFGGGMEDDGLGFDATGALSGLTIWAGQWELTADRHYSHRLQTGPDQGVRDQIRWLLVSAPLLILTAFLTRSAVGLSRWTTAALRRATA